MLRSSGMIHTPVELAQSEQYFAQLVGDPDSTSDVVTIVHDNPTCVRCCGRDLLTCSAIPGNTVYGSGSASAALPFYRQSLRSWYKGACNKVCDRCCCCNYSVAGGRAGQQEAFRRLQEDTLRSVQARPREVQMSYGHCDCLRTCVADEWSNDKILSPTEMWWSGRIVTFVSDMHLSCGFGIDDLSVGQAQQTTHDTSDASRVATAKDVALLDELMSRTLMSLGDRTVYLGDMYDMWCAVGGSMPISRARQGVANLGWAKPCCAPLYWGVDPTTRLLDDAENGRGGTRAKLFEDVRLAMQTNNHTAGYRDRLSASAVWLSSFAGNVIDRGNAFAGATLSCCQLEPWDALFPAIVDTWPRIHATIVDSVLKHRAIITAGNHDAAVAMCLARIKRSSIAGSIATMNVEPVPQTMHTDDYVDRHESHAPHDGHDGHVASSDVDTMLGTTERVPCYNSVEFGHVLRAEHGHRRDVTCDDRSVLSYSVSCMGCVAGHWRAQRAATNMNGCARKTFGYFASSVFGRFINYACCPLSAHRRLPESSAQLEYKDHHEDKASSGSLCLFEPIGDATDVDAATRIMDDGPLSYAYPPGPLGVVVLGHTHNLMIKRTGERVYVNSGNSCRPIRRVIGASLGKLEHNLGQIVDTFNAAAAAPPELTRRLTLEEESALTIDIAQVKFSADGKVEWIKTSLVNIVSQTLTTISTVRFTKQ